MARVCRTFCSTSRTVTPSLLIRFAISKTSCTRMGESPSDGSSNIRIFGRAISPRPIAHICCSPPLIVPAACFRRSFIRGKSS